MIPEFVVYTSESLLYWGCDGASVGRGNTGWESLFFADIDSDAGGAVWSNNNWGLTLDPEAAGWDGFSFATEAEGCGGSAEYGGSAEEAKTDGARGWFLPAGDAFAAGSAGFVFKGRVGGAWLGIAGDALGTTATIVVAGSIAATGFNALGGSFPWKGSTEHPAQVGSRLSSSGGGEIIGLYPWPRKYTGAFSQ